MGGCLHDRLLTVGVFYSQQKTSNWWHFAFFTLWYSQSRDKREKPCCPSNQLSFDWLKLKVCTEYVLRQYSNEQKNVSLKESLGQSLSSPLAHAVNIWAFPLAFLATQGFPFQLWMHRVEPSLWGGRKAALLPNGLQPKANVWHAALLQLSISVYEFQISALSFPMLVCSCYGSPVVNADEIIYWSCCFIIKAFL